MVTEMGVLLIDQLFEIYRFVDGSADHIDNGPFRGKTLISRAQPKRRFQEIGNTLRISPVNNGKRRAKTYLRPITSEQHVGYSMEGTADHTVAGIIE